jgi:hypothetical protein
VVLVLLEARDALRSDVAGGGKLVSYYPPIPDSLTLLTIE